MRSLWRTLLRFFFRLLYNEFAWSYDGVAWLASLGQWKAWSRTTIAHLHSGRVVELGHGPGHLLIAMADRGLAPVGVDLSEYMGRQARRRLRRAGMLIPLLRARAQALPVRDGSIDSVVATFPSEFIVDPGTMEEVRRVLRPSGRLVVAVWARLEGGGVLARLVRGLYAATGQNEPAPDVFKPWLERVGLSPQVVWEQVGRSTVMLVVAEKETDV